MMVTRSLGQPEGVQRRLVCTSGFSEASIEMHLRVCLSEEQLGHTSWNFGQGAEWHLAKYRFQIIYTYCETILFISRERYGNWWICDSSLHCGTWEKPRWAQIGRAWEMQLEEAETVLCAQCDRPVLVPVPVVSWFSLLRLTRRSQSIKRPLLLSVIKMLPALMSQWRTWALR